MSKELEWMMVRHGRTQWNNERRYQGHSDQPLLPGSEAGLEELRMQIQVMEFSKVYCSDLRRCKQTLAYLRPDLLHLAVYDKRLREMDFGQWEGQTYEQLKGLADYRSWIDCPEQVTPPDGESWSDFSNRVTAFCDEMEHHAAHITRQIPPSILIITHGGVISMIRSLLLGSPFWDKSAATGSSICLSFSYSDEGKRTVIMEQVREQL